MSRSPPLLALVACALALAPSAAPAAGQRRFALVVGNDAGGSDTRPLQYAAADARRMHEVLTQVGGVRPEDATLLANRPAGDLVTALARLEARVAEARRRGERAVLIVYYSGHAKDGALRLGETRLPLDELRARLAASAADIRIGVLDSCRSGVVTRTKGARRAPAFDVQAAGSEDARGLVILTSSSADEDAQEADDIGGSYFSHHLSSGLRGDADRSRDGRVTLSEAYAYAYARTVADTAESAAGAQHPTFSYDLKGNGDLVLSEYAARREGLYVPASAPAGTYYVIKAGFIAAEIVKPALQDRQIALAAGSYVIKRRLVDRLRIGELRVAAGQVVTLEEGRLRDAPFSDDPVKGARRDAGARWSLAATFGAQSFFDEPTRQGLFPTAGMLGAELALHDFFRRGWVWAVDLGFGGARSDLVLASMARLPFRFGEVTLGSSLLAEWSLADGRLVPFAGVRFAFLLMTRTFEGTEIPEQHFSTFSPGLLAGLRWRIAGGLGALARGRVHYLHYNVDQNRSLGYWELAGALAYEF